jgi:phosphatidylserine decarboxylase
MSVLGHVRDAMTFVRWGIPTLICATAVLAWALLLLPAGPARWCGVPVAAFCWLFTLAFFRNPHRKALGDQRCLIAPADGVVSDITEADEPLYVKERCLRVGIFLSVFDVHVNRSPVDGVIEFAQYRPGKFLDARHPDVTHQNEANILGVAAAPNVAAKMKLLVVQLSGLIARRIICTHGVGDSLSRGELYGMIKFGSRTELWIPLSQKHELKVTIGDRVKCGETILVQII